MLAGEAGGGKTRLARELAHEVCDRGALVLYGTSDAAVRIPYEPLRQWLEYLLRVCEPSELRECLGDGAILARLVPELAAVAEPAPPRGLSMSSPTATCFSVRRQDCSRGSRGRARCLAIADDVHWADDETLHLLRTLARTAPETRMLVVASYRDVPADTRPAVVDALADLWRIDGVTRLPLGRLTAEEVATLVRESASAEATPDLVSALTELTDGHAAARLRALARAPRDGRRGGLGRRRSGSSRRIEDVPGPERIRDAVRQRLGRLGPDVAAIVELAAVAGADVRRPAARRGGR